MNTWYEFLKEELESDYFKNLIKKVKLEYKEKTIYPKYIFIFRIYSFFFIL